MSIYFFFSSMQELKHIKLYQKKKKEKDKNL